MTLVAVLLFACIGVTLLYPCFVLAPQYPENAMWHGFGIAEAVVSHVEMTQ